MKQHLILSIVAVILILAFVCSETFAQSDLRKTEVGFVATALDMRDSIGEKPLGLGGRLAYNFTDNFAIDGEVTYFPQGGQGNNGQTQALAGLRAGVRIKKRVGLFAKIRPGFVRFGGNTFKALNNGARNYFALDVGGVLELYPSSRVIVRVDYGDTIIAFGDDSINTAGSSIPSRFGTTHNKQASFGIGFRF